MHSISSNDRIIACLEVALPLVVRLNTLISKQRTKGLRTKLNASLSPSRLVRPQEYLVVEVFNRELGLFLTLLQFFGYAAYAASARALHNEHKRKIPLKTYFRLGFLQVRACLCFSCFHSFLASVYIPGISERLSCDMRSPRSSNRWSFPDKATLSTSWPCSRVRNRQGS